MKIKLNKNQLKSNTEIHDLWCKHSYKSLKNLDLSDHYAALFIGSRFDLNQILKRFQLKPDQLFNHANPKVNLHLNYIDQALLIGIKVLNESVKRVYFNDVDVDDLIDEHSTVTDQLTELYTFIWDQLRHISYEINYSEYFDPPLEIT